MNFKVQKITLNFFFAPATCFKWCEYKWFDSNADFKCDFFILLKKIWFQMIFSFTLDMFQYISHSVLSINHDQSDWLYPYTRRESKLLQSLLLIDSTGSFFSWRKLNRLHCNNWFVFVSTSLWTSCQYVAALKDVLVKSCTVLVHHPN